MLEFNVPEQFLEQAKGLICANAVRFASSDRVKIFEDLMKEFKGDEFAPRMSAYSVQYHGDGTTTVKPLNIGFGGNEHAFLSVIENEGQTFMINKEGKSICIAPFQINGETYLRTFDPAEAPTIRETLGATLTPPKKPSAYDKICDFFATHILKRPGKAVQAYNDKKAYYDAMQKGLEKLTGISDKVDGYKQEHADELKRIEQERLEKQKELENQKEQERIQKEREEDLRKKVDEEIRRQAKEEARRKSEEAQAREKEQLLREKEKQYAKYEPEREKLLKEAEKRNNEIRLRTVRELQHSLPRKMREREGLVTRKADLQKEIEEAEKNLNVIKDDLAKKERWLKIAQDDLTKAKNTLKDLAKDLTEMEKLKKLQPQKDEQKRKLADAKEAIPVLEQQIKEAEENYKKCAAEYNKVSDTGHIYVMKPEQYLEHVYNQAKAGREEILRLKRAELAEQMKEVEDQIQKRDLSQKQIDSQTKTWEKIPLINIFSDKPEIRKAEKTLKADLEKQYKALQKKDAELLKDFEEKEAQYKKLSLNVSPEELNQTEEYLKAGFAALKAKQQAFKDADTRVDKLTGLLMHSRGEHKRAQQELERLNQESDGKDYNEELHTRTQDLHQQYKTEIATLTKQCTDIKREVNERSLLVHNAEYDLKLKKDSLPKMDDRYRELGNEIDHDKAQIVNFTRDLHKAGIAVEPSPEMQQLQQPKQPQARPKAPVKGVK